MLWFLPNWAPRQVRKMEAKRRNMAEVNLKEMLEAGVHFGHKTDKWNPKMSPFIFTQRNGVHIFDLAKTKEGLEAAGKFAEKVASDGGSVLFVGTKNQIRGVVRSAAEASGMPFLTERWPGGMLTNFHTILGRLKYMKDAEAKLETGESRAKGTMTKKESLNLKRELEKLSEVFEGVKELRKVPEALFVADIMRERIAVREAKKLGIPVIGIADTNANPDVEYAIPANDDAVRSVKYIADYLSAMIAGGKPKATTPATEVEGEEPARKEEEKKEEEQIKDEGAEKIDKIEMEAEEKATVKKSKSEEDAKEENKNKEGK